jgi:hypothetical protein
LRASGSYFWAPNLGKVNFRNLGKVNFQSQQEIIGNSAYGDLAENNRASYADEDTSSNDKDSFIDISRIDELRDVHYPDFDLSRLIKLCEELNDNFFRGNLLSVSFLGRAIIDHIPPIFQCVNFDGVANNNSGSGKSFKGNMGRLNTLYRHVADNFLHQYIRRYESLPNKTTIDFRSDMDVLLAEVVRLLKQP